MLKPDEPLIFESFLEKDGIKVSKSPWGPDDQIGRVNWITPESQRAVLESLNGQHVFDLSLDYFIGMPMWLRAGHPPYSIWMTNTPRGSVLDNATGAGADLHEKFAYCGDSIAMYTHCGTHMDMLNHFGYFGCFWNGWKPEERLGSRHWRVGGPENYPPIIARGVLLDIAGLHGIECLPESHVITPGELRDAMKEERIEIRRGDVVLIRTGLMSRWPDEYPGNTFSQPGIGMAAARFLCEEAGAMCIGADNSGLEVLPAESPDTFQPVHCYMFATAGAQIIELLWLQELAAEKQFEFAFLGFPMKLRGATGAPMRVVAVPLRK